MPIFVLKLKKKSVRKSWIFEIQISKQFYDFKYIGLGRK